MTTVAPTEHRSNNYYYAENDSDKDVFAAVKDHHHHYYYRLAYSADPPFAQPALSANITPQAGVPHQYHQNNVSTESFQAPVMSPVDLSPPVTPIPAAMEAQDDHLYDPTTSSLKSSKRSMTTSVMPSRKDSHFQIDQEQQERHDDDVYAVQQQPPSSLKRHSTNQSHRDSGTTTAAAARPLGRHNTTGHVLRSRQKQLEQEIGISEEFAKELHARRRAFKRMSRRITEDPDDERVLMGTRVDKHHRNYVLMYNMLTGIRIAVGRVSAKANRQLTDEDFTAAHKLAFNV